MTTTESPAGQTTLNIPSLIAFAILSILAFRYFLSPSSSASNNQASSSTHADSRQTRRQQRQQVLPDRIDTIASMFPQLRRRDIEWDLLRNGASVQATSERVLREGRLSAAPPSFRATTPPPIAPSNNQNPNQSSASKSPQHPDLITRYDLKARLDDPPPTSSRKGKEKVVNADAGGALARQAQQARGSWSSNKAERAELLKRRREHMVLQARRRMLEREGSGSGGVDAAP